MNALDLLYWPLATITAPVWARKTRGGWPERFGRTAPLPARASRPRLMIHAVSVGEVSALRSLIPLLAPHVEVVVSVGTDTGIARARQLFAQGDAPMARPLAHVVRYPLDFSASVRRFLDAVRPDAVALVELELWPNFIRACTKRKIPVCVINGRLSERSFRGYRRIRPFIGGSFRALACAAVQDEAYAQRFIYMGVPPDRCPITGSMKWDAAKIEDQVPGAAKLAEELRIDRARPLIVAGSTGPGEEALLHAACPAGVQLVCAPRKPERFDEAALALPGCRRRSAGPVAGFSNPRVQGGSATDRFLLDTIGELRQAYALADLVVVGRSFMGDLYGSDPIEPIALGKPTVMGPYHSDFQSVVAAFIAAGGIRIGDRDALPATLAALIGSASDRASLAARGRACIRNNQGASARHAALLLELIRSKVASRDEVAGIP